MHPSPPLLTITLADLADTDRLGAWLATHLPGGTCLGLVGTLGAGKTRLAQAIIAAEGIARSEVTSPTFALLRTYRGSHHTLHHLDAYRIQDDDEFLELGVEELWEDDSALVLVEWASRVEDCLPPATLWIDLEWTPGERRVVKFHGPEDHWQSRIAGLAGEFGSV